MRPLVILRPEPGATATAKAAEALGLRAIVLPLFAVEPVEWQTPPIAEFDGLLLTSANAVRCAGAGLAQLLALPANCVGEATARAASEAGLATASVGNSGVEALLDSISANLRLLHLCGAERREVPDHLQSIRAIPVYRSEEQDLGSRILSIEGAVVAVHSPRAGAVLARRALERGVKIGTVAVAAISDAAAAACGEGWERVEVASEPSDAAVLSLALQLCDKLG